MVCYRIVGEYIGLHIINFSCSFNLGEGIMETIIDVEKDKVCKDIFISISGITLSMDNMFDTTTVRFWLKKDKAEQLRAFLNSELEDCQRGAGI